MAAENGGKGAQTTTNRAILAAVEAVADSITKLDRRMLEVENTLFRSEIGKPSLIDQVRELKVAMDSLVRVGRFIAATMGGALLLAVWRLVLAAPASTG